LQAGAAGAGAAGLAASGAGLAVGVFGSAGPRPRKASAGGVYDDDMPTSPLILDPFRDPLPIPRALAPVPRSVVATWKSPPGNGAGQQDSFAKTHQLWPGALGYPEPIVYQVRLQLAPHRFTTSQVLPIDSDGNPAESWDERRRKYAAGTKRTLPASAIYGFNGTFPGPMINAEYGRPCLVRFQNELDKNPYSLDRQDFGAPDYSFVTHLHNGHTAPESDGNPGYVMSALGLHGYPPGSWVDNLYLNYPAGGDEREKQSFFWFHDHRMDHTSSNVYKGLVGLYPIYDPAGAKDMGDETRGLRLPGVRTNRPDGAFDVAYDIPLAFFDVRLDDGVTDHHDIHDGEFPLARNPREHREWWGKSFFRHSVNKGFVGDIFTVNGVASPQHEVKRRKYRLRLLCASIARVYEFKLMASPAGPRSAVSLGYVGDDLQGQHRIPDGRQCMKFVQVANDGGLLPSPVARDSVALWPAKRSEVIVDFSRYMDGTPTKKGDVIYLANVMKMTTGRKPEAADPAYKVPLLKFVIGDDAPDNSLIPTGLMRAAPPLPGNLSELVSKRRVFEVQRDSFGPEIEWLINGVPFEPDKPLAQPKRGTSEVWEVRNDSGGWVHPFHIHQEEHRVIRRNGKPAPDGRHPDDTGKEDVIALDPGESVMIARQFRTFTGHYVAHCHNLAHEDHAMMFGWEIVP
jgi:FtsP/CotA-like multicopper oxidase with cupredoxin domain